MTAVSTRSIVVARSVAVERTPQRLDPLGAQSAWLLVPLLIPTSALVLCQEPQSLLCNVRMIGQHLERGDQAIPTEERNEPWHTRGKVGVLSEVGSQDVQAAK